MKPFRHLLLVEDDATSRAFLTAALERMPSQADAAADSASAMALARAHPYAAFLIDAHLPDGSGIALLQALRGAGARGPALAHTASTDGALHARLREAGFIDVLVKPLSAAALVAAVSAALGVGNAGPDITRARDGHEPEPLAPDALPIWDTEAAARAAGGRQAHMNALRAMFLGELPGVRARVRETVGDTDPARLRAELHRLHASCGFVGAVRVGAAARVLQDDPGSLQLERFEAAVDATLAPTVP